MGTVEELGEKILEDTDWKVKKDSDNPLRQTIEEPLYVAIITSEKEARDILDDNKTLLLKENDTIYIFYNNIINKTPFMQFLWSENKKPEVDDDNVIISKSNWYIDDVEYTEEGLPDFVKFLNISDEYRGDRLVRKSKTTYDATIDKYVGIYQDSDGKEVYGFMETEYNSPALVQNYITNGTDFISEAGWSVGGVSSEDQTIYPDLLFVTVPDIRDITEEDFINNPEIVNSYLKIKTSSSGQMLYNSGIIDYRQKINGFSQGEKYVFRIKYGEADVMGEHGAHSLKNSKTNLKFTIAKYKLENGIYNIDEENIYFQETIIPSESFDYVYKIAECKNSLSYSEMIEMSSSLGFFIEAESSSSDLYIEDVQFFNYVPVEEENVERPLFPGEIWTESQVVNTYYYYYPSKDYSSIEDISFIYKGNTPSTVFLDYYDKKYEKVRSIKASESNRFNLLQDLCEIFECWVKFEIKHEKDGSISLDENYRPEKWVSFHEYIGKDNYAGFKYGINLKSIEREINSDAIVSKVIVKNNSNEFAKDGFCSIARASENPSGENFILDFSYYIQQRLLIFSELTNDLYSDINGHIGYYKKLKEINNLRDLYIEEQSKLFTDLADYQSTCQIYTTLLFEAEEELREQEIRIYELTGLTFQNLLNDKQNSWWDNNETISVMSSIGRLTNLIPKYENYLESAKENLANAQKRFDELTRILTEDKFSEDNPEERRLLIEKKELHKTFYQKYSRFLQEGSWISEDYIDDELYYLDAYGTAHTSSQPQISYNISVLELSQLEGYENYAFALGDKTTIEDVEFFGWAFKDGVQTPYKEEVVVTEITILLDSPESNEIKIQNYKTQFEDLFQRITATTQSIEYSTGQYNKAAGIVETDGTISANVLQNSVLNNSLILSNAQDQSVIWDETGITTTNLKNPSEIVRIVGGGIFLSTDGGTNWYTGITGRGINANYITTGQLDTSKINVYNGSFPSFRWDGNGISAFNFSINESTGAVQNFNYSKFVRYDQYGIYGINGNSEFNPNIADSEGEKGEDKIWKNANYALTWKGFMLKNDDGSVRITSNEDIQVLSNNTERIKIGRIANNVYGIKISDASGAPVMITKDDGTLWLQNSLFIGSENQKVEDATVQIGYLKNVRPNSNVHEVIHAGSGQQQFIVYEDGKMTASGVEIHGDIYATGGQIGGLTIEQWAEKGYEVLIVSDSGNVLKENSIEFTTLTAHLYHGSTEITDGLEYQWFKDNAEILGATQKEYIVLIEDLNTKNESATYSCVISYDAAN